ncbi:MAG: serine/threonine-protein kinase [Nannocystaceae bacterium]
MIDPGELEEEPSRPPQPPPNLVGTILAERYQLLKCIAEGGMGMVYLAEHITIGRRLAVKVLSADLGNSPEVVQRFLGEARAASMIQHEHIVDIIDFGYTAQGQAFLAMEYLEGEDLATTLDREKRLPWHRLRRMVLQMCRALHAAHEKGVIHRDMKPDNCFRIKRGGNADFIKLLDFGIAKVMTEATTSRSRASGAVGHRRRHPPRDPRVHGPPSSPATARRRTPGSTSTPSASSCTSSSPASSPSGARRSCRRSPSTSPRSRSRRASGRPTPTSRRRSRPSSSRRSPRIRTSASRTSAR